MTTIAAAISRAFDYLSTQQVEIPLDIWQKTIASGVLKASGDLSAISSAYSNAIEAALTSYLSGGPLPQNKNAFKRATVEAFGGAFDLGTIDGGGSIPADDDALAWFNSKVQAEFGFIDLLFTQAKELRQDTEADHTLWVRDRAEGYSNTLTSIYNAAMMWADKRQMLTWNLGNTERHCKTCVKLNGQRHRASWYISRGYIPRQPGANLACGGYFCDCRLVNDKGETVTV